MIELDFRAAFLLGDMSGNLSIIYYTGVGRRTAKSFAFDCYFLAYRSFFAVGMFYKLAGRG